jgi:hypothetical protein
VGFKKTQTTPDMKMTAALAAPRFATLPAIDAHLSQEITRPFFDTLRHPAHDMMLLTPHTDLLPHPEPAPLGELLFFNFDRP